MKSWMNRHQSTTSRPSSATMRCNDDRPPVSWRRQRATTSTSGRTVHQWWTCLFLCFVTCDFCWRIPPLARWLCLMDCNFWFVRMRMRTKRTRTTMDRPAQTKNPPNRVACASASTKIAKKRKNRKKTTKKHVIFFWKINFQISAKSNGCFYNFKEEKVKKSRPSKIRPTKTKRNDMSSIGRFFFFGFF